MTIQSQIPRCKLSSNLNSCRQKFYIQSQKITTWEGKQIKQFFQMYRLSEQVNDLCQAPQTVGHGSAKMKTLLDNFLLFFSLYNIFYLNNLNQQSSTVFTSFLPRHIFGILGRYIRMQQNDNFNIQVIYPEAK